MMELVRFNRQSRLSRTFWVFALLLLMALLIPLGDQTYYTKLISRICIFSIVAMSLDLIVGYAGMVSLGHAAFFGVGVYSAGVLAQFGWTQWWEVLPCAVMVAAFLGFFIGAISLRASGLYFIFITLAFSQMVFFVAQGLRMYGGDDGFRLPAPTQWSQGLEWSQPRILAYTMIFFLLLIYVLSKRVIDSNFGKTIVASRDNAKKVNSLGLQPYPFKLILFVISASFSAIAGVGFANLNDYVSPASISWVQSGEFLFMVILGSAGTLLGPILGAAAFVVLEQILSTWTEFWMFYLGIILMLRVLFLKTGLLGVMSERDQDS
jgi:branched-chain amino acid transport system permease protein